MRAEPDVPPGQLPPDLELVVGLGLAVALLCGSAEVLGLATGVIRTDEKVPLFVRAVILPFGGVLGVFGARMLYMPLALIAEGQGAREWPSVLALGAWRTLVRVDLHSLLAAATLAPLAWDCWHAARGLPTWGPRRNSLIEMVQLEFLVIHGFVFLVLAATLVLAPVPSLRRFGIGSVVAVLALYSGGAWQIAGGAIGMAFLLYLFVPNVLAFARPATSIRPRAIAVARWGFKTIAFVGVAVLLEETSLRGDGNLRVGTWYFAIQALTELFRVAEMPVELGAAWAGIPASRRRAMGRRAADSRS